MKMLPGIARNAPTDFRRGLLAVESVLVSSEELHGMDFIFGTLATDELKVLHHRALRYGLQHGHRITPRDPQPGEAVTLTVTVGPNCDVDAVVCYYTTDGSEPVGERGEALNGQVLQLESAGVEWDTITWGYLVKWQGVIPAQPDSTTVRYRIGGWAEGQPEIFADWPHVKDLTDAAAGAFFSKQPLPDLNHAPPTYGDTFNYHVDTFRPPAWAYDAMIYHIFVDRFYPGDGKAWLQTDDPKAFCGGTLWGIRDRMAYIAELGVNCIWLSPTCASPTAHGYDVVDYYKTEPRLGGDDALHAVIEAAHRHDIRVIFDLVCNHSSNEHPYFKSAHNNPNSPHRAWYTFNGSSLGYRAFFNVANMPQINVAHPEARAWLLDVARHWLREFEVDGYRLDHAQGPGPGFWSDFLAVCKDEKPDSFCFGEIIDAQDVQQTYVGRLDGILDFYIGEALRKTYAYGEWSQAEFERFVKRHTRYTADTFLQPTFLDNHDMDRFLFIAGGDKAKLRRAAATQMRLPAPPVIYYGTEVGLSQREDTQTGGLDVSRLPMLWGDEQDTDLLDFYRDLIHTRRENTKVNEQS